MHKKNNGIWAIYLILLTFPMLFAGIPLFANSGGELLNRYGFVAGDSNGDLMLEQKLTREQFAVLLCKLYGRSIEAARFKRPPNYRDAYQFSSWSKNYISYAQYMGWMLGVGDRRFDHAGAVSDKQLAVALTKVLGYAPKDTLEALSILESLGIHTSPSEALTRGEAFEVMWQVVSRPIMKNGKILGEVTGRLQGDLSGFEVKQIRSDNFGFLVVEFNKPVDAVSVNRNSLQMVNVETGNPVEISSVRVFGNKVFFYPLQNFVKGGFDCTVSGINSGWGESDKMLPLMRRVFIDDVDKPKCIGLEFNGEREITLIFDEPIASVGSVRLRLGNINIGLSGTGIIGLGTERITFGVFANLQDGKTYEVKTRNFKDLTGKASVETKVSEIYVKQSKRPVLQIGEQTAEYVELIFSSPVKGLEESKFYHTGPEKRPLRITASPDVQSPRISKNDYIDRAYLWFYDSTSERNYPIPSSETVLYVDEKGISDGFNEMLMSGVYTVKSGEAVPKTRVEFVKIESPDKLKIGLNQKAKRPIVRIRNEEGAEISLRNGRVLNSGEFEYLFPNEIRTKSLFIEISGEDESFSAHRVEIRIGDREPPRVVNAVKKNGEDGYFLIVNFNEEVDDSALLLSNYQMITSGGVQNITGRIERINRNCTVSISVSRNDYVELVDKSAEIYISGIKDLAGNTMTGLKVKVSGK